MRWCGATSKKQQGEVAHGITHTMTVVIRESSPTNKGRCPDVGRTKLTGVTEVQDRDPPGIEPRASPNLVTILPTTGCVLIVDGKLKGDFWWLPPVRFGKFKNVTGRKRACPTVMWPFFGLETFPPS
jgi:hypothetical protein